MSPLLWIARQCFASQIVCLALQVPTSAGIDVRDVPELSTPSLKRELLSRGSSTYGNPAVLRQRLRRLLEEEARAADTEEFDPAGILPYDPAGLGISPAADAPQVAEGDTAVDAAGLVTTPATETCVVAEEGPCEPASIDSPVVTTDEASPQYMPAVSSTPEKPKVSLPTTLQDPKGEHSAHVVQHIPS